MGPWEISTQIRWFLGYLGNGWYAPPNGSVNGGKGNSMDLGNRAPKLFASGLWIICGTGRAAALVSGPPVASVEVNISSMPLFSTAELRNLKRRFWVNYNDLTVLPHWKSWLGFGKSSPNGRTIRVSEILEFKEKIDLAQSLDSQKQCVFLPFESIWWICLGW